MIRDFIPYTKGFINRAAERRREHNDLIKEISADNSLVIPVKCDFNLISTNNDTQPALQYLKPSTAMAHPDLNPVFLGTANQHNIYCVDVSNGSLDDELVEDAEFVDLRQLGTQLSPDESSIALTARGIQYWHRTHPFCARCGHKTVSTEGGHSRTCGNSTCKHVTYPRISPAVIVLIEHRSPDGTRRCLLGKGHRSWGNIRSTLAGFVEVGESLEEAVRREMKEEAGLDVYNIKYMGSQPWPFPSSLMVGFFAQADSLELRIDTEEILEATWYSKDEIITQSARNEITLSREDSIARYLIETWINSHP